jgi:hypothetical protein
MLTPQRGSHPQRTSATVEPRGRSTIGLSEQFPHRFAFAIEFLKPGGLDEVNVYGAGCPVQHDGAFSRVNGDYHFVRAVTGNWPLNSVYRYCLFGNIDGDRNRRLLIWRVVRLTLLDRFGCPPARQQNFLGSRSVRGSEGQSYC